jgi:transcriptional regulator with XRE-family HTH domain
MWRTPWRQLGEQLRGTRERKQWSQQYVAMQAGMDQGQLSRCERGMIRPSRERLAALAQVLNLDLGKLLVLAQYELPVVRASGER